MIKASIDSRNFDRAFADYMQWSRKAPSEVVNTKLYFIARNAVNTTKHVDKEKIGDELNAPSRNYPSAPLAGVIVNTTRKHQGKRGLNGGAMKAAIEKMIRKRKSSVNFVRGGWKKAIKRLESLVKMGDVKFSRRGKAPIPNGIKESPRHHGNAVVARPVPNTYGEINNALETFKESENLTEVMTEGLNKAIQLEVASMNDYISKKWNEQHAKLNS